VAAKKTKNRNTTLALYPTENLLQAALGIDYHSGKANTTRKVERNNRKTEKRRFVPENNWPCQERSGWSYSRRAEPGY
jgi:hypothetical protein